MLISNKHNLPQSIYTAICNDTYNGPKVKDDTKISLTSLIGPVRIHELKKRYWDDPKMTQDASGMLWSLHGTAMHLVLERSEDSQHIKEERMEVMVDGIILSGQADMMSLTELADHKNQSVWGIIFEPEGKREHHAQLNVLRWLAFKKGFDGITKLKNHLFLRDHSKRDYKSYQKKGDNRYPPIPFVTIDIPIWPMEQTEAYIKDRVKQFKAARTLLDRDLPKCTPEELWDKVDKKTGNVKHNRCPYCLGRFFCDDYKVFLEKGEVDADE